MDWIKNCTPKESLEILRDIALRCKSHGGTVTQQLCKLVEQSDFRGLIDFQIDYDRMDVTDAIYARQVLGFFTKLPMLPLGINCENVAYQSFLRSEAMCAETNKRFRFGAAVTPWVEPILHRAQLKISQILGNLPSFEALKFSFGPGANTNVSGMRACNRFKLGASLVCSANFAPVAGDLLAEVPEWMAIHSTSETEDNYYVDLTVSPGKLSFVPKNCKTHRAIVVEPLLNSFFQKGVGTAIKQRLINAGLKLKDQTHNQKLAKEGSVTGKLATMDLSMASDCVSKNLVSSLLPLEWYSLMDALRTPQVTYDGALYNLEKFSSMGNAFTFELETLIFYALSFAVCEHLQLETTKVSTFGDDIIVPTEAYETLERTLTYCGFVVNSDKSFYKGRFRESCGADYLDGFAIRPFYQKTLINGRTLYVMYNWFIRHCEFDLANGVLEVMKKLNISLLWGPDGYGDGHLIGDHSLYSTRASKRKGWCGGYFDTFSLKQRSCYDLSPGDAVLPAYSVYVRSGEESETDPNTVRGSVGYSRIAIYTLSTGIFSRV